MRFRSRTPHVVATLGALSLTIGLSGIPAGAASSPVVVVRPAVREPTRPVQVVGHRFGVDSAVAVRLAGRVVARATTDDHGVFHASFTVPWGTPSGQYVVAASQGSDGVRASTHLLVRVNWPQVGFNSRRSNYNYLESVIGTGTVGTLHELWSSQFAQGWFQVLEDNGSLFTYSPYRVVSIDPASGATRWSIQAGSGDGISGMTIANGTVYVSYLSTLLQAFDEVTGQFEWIASNGDESDSPTGPPVVSGSMVLVPFHESVVAVSTITHQLVWTTALDTTPLGVSLANGVLYATTPGYLYAIDAGTGAISWSAPIADGGAEHAPVLDGNGSIYVSTGAGSLLRIDAASGEVIWSSNFGATGNPMSAPAIANGVAYALGPGPDDVAPGDMTLGAIDTATGAVKWTTPTHLADQQVSVANGVLYLSDMPSHYVTLEAYDAGDGAHLTSYQLDTLGATVASVTAVNGTLYVADEKVYAFAP